MPEFVRQHVSRRGGGIIDAVLAIDKQIASACSLAACRPVRIDVMVDAVDLHHRSMIGTADQQTTQQEEQEEQEAHLLVPIVR